MVVKSYESKSTVDRVKELEKIVFKTHSPLEVRDVMKSVEEYANTIYNQALEDFKVSLEKHQQDNWIDNLEYGITFADVESVIDELKK